MNTHRDCEPSWTVLQSPPATNSAAIVFHQMARRRKRPRCRPGRRNVPRAPNPPDKATPSHPQPTMGGTSPPTLSDLTLARANDRALCSHQPSLQVLQATAAHGSAAVTILWTACRHKRPRRRPGRRKVPRAPNPPNEATPSLQPFTFDEGAFHTSGGGNAYPFHARDLPLPPWKQTRRKYRPHRTCRRHQPRAPNQSTGWA